MPGSSSAGIAILWRFLCITVLWRFLFIIAWIFKFFFSLLGANKPLENVPSGSNEERATVLWRFLCIIALWKSVH